ncbi:hypothetical protein [Actinomyces viscosus]|uniref:hypothetical protein n=1 Tax=Actinomyces viscosus TaxID=1656 RepID=UPI0028EF6754|nr:hypothetical protein [Actinomyces viscosus]
MPRIVTIVGAEAPTVEMFVATTIVREPRFYVRQLLTGAGFGLIPKDRPHRAAIEILNPTTVADPREITRLLGVTTPSHWQPTIVTRCSVPFGEMYDQYVDIAVDAAEMSGGIAVMNGRRLPLPDPWHWRRNEEGKWTPDNDFVDACIARYKAAHQDTGASPGKA